MARYTILPYTTLFRSPRNQSRTERPRQGAALRRAGKPLASDAIGQSHLTQGTAASASAKTRGLCARPKWHSQRIARSEEHTSELQSLAYLVCRLLLEK